MIKMALHLFGYDLRAFARNRQSQFFTLAMPVLLLVILPTRCSSPTTRTPRGWGSPARTC